MRNVRFQIIRNLGSLVIYTGSIKSELERTEDGIEMGTPIIPLDIVPEETRQELSEIHARLTAIKEQIETNMASQDGGAK